MIKNLNSIILQNLIISVIKTKFKRIGSTY